MKYGKKDWTFLKITHLLICLALGFVMVIFFVQHTPARQVWRTMTAQQERAAAIEKAKKEATEGKKASPTQTALGNGFGANLAAKMRAVTPILWPDIILGILSWVGFFVGTGVYSRRLEIWLALHGSGQVAAVRGIGIQSQTLQSNVGRKGGIE